MTVAGDSPRSWQRELHSAGGGVRSGTALDMTLIFFAKSPGLVWALTRYSAAPPSRARLIYSFLPKYLNVSLTSLLYL